MWWQVDELVGTFPQSLHTLSALFTFWKQFSDNTTIIVIFNLLKDGSLQSRETADDYKN